MLAAVEEACGEEDHGNQNGQLGMLEGVLAQCDEATGEPGGASDEPYPGEVLHTVRMPLVDLDAPCPSRVIGALALH